MKPLDDITIVEIDSWMAAPSAGAVLADLGAEVIKVEPLSGDPMRDMGRPARLRQTSRIMIFSLMWTIAARNPSVLT